MIMIALAAAALTNLNETAYIVGRCSPHMSAHEERVLVIDMKRIDRRLIKAYRQGKQDTVKMPPNRQVCQGIIPMVRAELKQ